MQEILINIILLIIVIYSVGFGIYMMLGIKTRKNSYEDFKKRSDEQLNRAESKILHEDLKK